MILPDEVTGRKFLSEWDDFATRWHVRYGERLSGIEVGPELFEAIRIATREAGYESDLLSETQIRRITAAGVTIITKRAPVRRRTLLSFLASLWTKVTA